MAVLDQVVAPLIVAANIVTFGAADAASDAVDAVKVGNKFIASSTRIGRALLRVANKLQTVSPVKAATKVVRVKETLVKKQEVASSLFGAWQNFGHVFAEDFAEHTSNQVSQYCRW